MIKTRIFFTILLTIGVTSHASAFVDGQLLLGQRFAKFDADGSSDDVTGTEVTLAAHLSPLPIFGFGLYFTTIDYNTSSGDKVVAFDELKGNQLGAEVTADFPIDIFDLGLYGKAGYSFYGTYKGSVSGQEFAIPETNATATYDVDAEYKVSGYKLAAGLKWTPIAIVSALIELNYGAERWELDELKLDGSGTDTGDGDLDQTFTTILLGAEAAI